MGNASKEEAKELQAWGGWWQGGGGTGQIIFVNFWPLQAVPTPVC